MRVGRSIDVQMEPSNLDIDGLISIGPVLRAISKLLDLPDRERKGRECLNTLDRELTGTTTPLKLASQKLQWYTPNGLGGSWVRCSY